MSELIPSIVPLDKGLDLQTAKLIAPPGSTLDSLNYEQVDFQGQKRIEGYARYDGSTLPALDDYYVITTTSPMTVGQHSTVNSEKGLFGVRVHVSGNTNYIVVLNEQALPSIGETVGGAQVTGITKGVNSGVSPSQHYDNLLQFMQVLKAKIGLLPGGVIGLHWFRDRLYAVADVAVFQLSGTNTGLAPNDIITSSLGSARVWDVYLSGNNTIVYTDSTTPWPVGTTVSKNGSSLGSTQTPTSIPLGAYPLASIYESRTEQQVLDEDGPSGPYDFGWRARHLGWTVNFYKGTVLYGNLASLNQNRQGVGTQGPTSDQGSNGSPLALFQKVSITNAPVQVNGWKSSTSPTTYQLDSGLVSAMDSGYVYADAFVRWSGTSPTVVAQGIDQQNMVENPSTNKVTLEEI